MEFYTLKNDKLTVSISDHGAELKSVIRQSDGTEYMWQADPAYWGRTSPVLFPLVGNLAGRHFRHKGKSYQMTQHGFARDMDFMLLNQSGTAVSFRLTDTEETYEKYPFHFVLDICYVLADSSLQVKWHVKNPDRLNPLYFSIGAHPAFNCPLAGGRWEDYYLGFDARRDLTYGIVDEGGTLSDKIRRLPLQNGLYRLRNGMFDEDAFVIEHDQAHQVSLLTPTKKPYVTVTFDAPLFAVWAPAKEGTPFICIEPWYGRCDRTSFTGDLKDREYGNILNAGNDFQASYLIEFA